MTLEEAWEQRQKLLTEGKALFAKADGMAKDRFTVQPNAKVTVWFAGMSAHYDHQATLSEARNKFYLADILWHDSVLKYKGNIRMMWSEEKESGFWSCELETGEVFRP